MRFYDANERWFEVQTLNLVKAKIAHIQALKHSIESSDLAICWADPTW